MDHLLGTYGWRGSRLAKKKFVSAKIYGILSLVMCIEELIWTQQAISIFLDILLFMMREI